MIPIEDEEIELCGRLARIVEGLPGLGEGRVCSDGIHNSGEISFDYRETPDSKRKSFYLSIGSGGKYVDVMTEDSGLAEKIKEHIEKKYPGSRYEKPKNVINLHRFFDINF
jgi:di/tripeptidase